MLQRRIEGTQAIRPFRMTLRHEMFQKDGMFIKACGHGHRLIPIMLGVYHRPRFSTAVLAFIPQLRDHSHCALTLARVFVTEEWN
jgi:hypothetical protein